jgi:hypothetical protein
MEYLQLLGLVRPGTRLPLEGESRPGNARQDDRQLTGHDNEDEEGDAREQDDDGADQEDVELLAGAGEALSQDCQTQ